MTTISAAIVAGGASSRFGGIPKGLEKVGGRRIIDRVIDAVRPVASDICIVSNAEDASAWVNGVRAVKDVRPERGSIVGIHTALATTLRPTLVVAWDMPFVSAELVAAIVERGATERFAVVAETSTGLEPFCALYTPACIPFVEAAIGEGDLRATALAQRFPSFTVFRLSAVAAFGEPGTLFFNVNSAEDLARAEEIEITARRSRRG